ncbi:hypothetical protein [Ornithinimicrobium avium]|uniref:DUF4878 domain-containing protein n=1 Tax=Ornithinimicrobium avium TaxID=2283195 RepID=A0A345NQB6_9MICO|nr:hypothetical protein [Ornithinimicrobium avium]AXH97224.1 hypothetical protein DV701_14850 [Ornithinimicrobium avium]
MRRALTTALAVSALVLAGCSGDEDPGTTPSTAPGDAPASTGAPAPTAPTDAVEETSDETSSTADPDAGGEVEGGEEGQAAADVAKEFLLAMVDADPRACDYLLSFTDIERPMTAVKADHEMCVELLPEVLKAETEAQGLDPAAAAALQGLQITGADVDGDTAVVDGDNYAEEFAEPMGRTTITLKQIDGEWYVDLDNSFAAPTEQ